MGIFSKSFDPWRDLSDMSGKVAIVTGGNSGIGFASVKFLARCGCKVYVAGRDEAKLASALERVESEGTDPGNGEVFSIVLDLADPRKAKACAEEFLGAEDRLDILINNAAWLTGPYRKSVDGVVDSMMTNHIGPFVFTQMLLPLMKETAKLPDSDVRIINVSAAAHKNVPVDMCHFRNLNDLNQEFANTALPAYSQFVYTKLANILFIKSLQTRLSNESIPITCMALHPGQVDTYKIPLGIKTVSTKLKKMVTKSADKGAYTSVFAAASPLIRKNRAQYQGVYLEPIGKVAVPSKAAEDRELAEELWVATEVFLKGIGMEFHENGDEVTNDESANVAEALAVVSGVHAEEPELAPIPSIALAPAPQAVAA